MSHEVGDSAATVGFIPTLQISVSFSACFERPILEDKLESAYWMLYNGNSQFNESRRPAGIDSLSCSKYTIATVRVARRSQQSRGPLPQEIPLQGCL